MKVVDLFQDQFENGNEASRLDLNFRNLEHNMLARLLFLPPIGFAYSHSVRRSVHLLSNPIINSSWLSRDHVIT